jgi:hypothetical protein
MSRWTLVALAGAAWTVACGLDTSGLGPADLEGGASSGSGGAIEAGVDGAASSGGSGGGASGGGSGGASGSGSGSGSGGASGSSSSGGSGSGSGSASSGSGGSGGSDGGPGAACVSGWTLVLGEMGSASCPAGYPGAYQGVANPQAQTGACTCSCTITKQPTCTVGNLSWTYGNQAPACPSASNMYSTGNCTALLGSPQLGTAQQVQPIPLTGGTCAGQAVGDTSMVQQTQVQTCSVPDANAASVCSGTVPSGFSACVIAPGDVPCPSGSPFSNRTVIADSEMLVCSGCSACSVTGTCQDPILAVYSDGQCKNVVATITADGQCTDHQGGMVSSWWYQAQVDAQCSASGTNASFQPTNPQTLCCR